MNRRERGARVWWIVGGSLVFSLAAGCSRTGETYGATSRRSPLTRKSSPPAVKSTSGPADRTSTGPASATQPGLHPLRVGDQTLQVELAVTEETRRRGLMSRRDLPPGRGMLFIFKRAKRVSFWMKDTLIPLDVAFADGRGRIFQIERMEALSRAQHVSRRPARYALEVPAGWFAEHRIAPGAVLTISGSIRRTPVE